MTTARRDGRDIGTDIRITLSFEDISSSLTPVPPVRGPNLDLHRSRRPVGEGH